MDAQKVYAEPQRGHVSLGQPLRTILFFVPVVILGLVLFWSLGRGTDVQKLAGGVTEVIFAVLWGILVSGIRIAAQWERGVVLRLGKFQSVKGPGIMYIVPFVDNVRFVDLRLLTLNIPSQQVITKDNVPAAIDGVLFFLVADAEKAVILSSGLRFCHRPVRAGHVAGRRGRALAGRTLDRTRADSEADCRGGGRTHPRLGIAS